MNSWQKYVKYIDDYSTTFHAFNKVRIGFDYVRVYVCVCVCVCARACVYVYVYVCVSFNISSTTWRIFMKFIWNSWLHHHFMRPFYQESR